MHIQKSKTCKEICSAKSYAAQYVDYDVAASVSNVHFPALSVTCPQLKLPLAVLDAAVRVFHVFALMWLPGGIF